MSHRARALVGIAAVALCLSSVSQALAAGDARSGQELARIWCNGCHVVDRSGRGPDTAPAFQTIARHNPADRAWLRAWLTAPHPPMPNLSLSRQQIDDIVAYLDSMTPR